MIHVLGPIFRTIVPFSEAAVTIDRQTILAAAEKWAAYVFHVLRNRLWNSIKGVGNYAAGLKIALSNKNSRSINLRRAARSRISATRTYKEWLSKPLDRVKETATHQHQHLYKDNGVKRAADILNPIFKQWLPLNSALPKRRDPQDQDEDDPLKEEEGEGEDKGRPYLIKAYRHTSSECTSAFSPPSQINHISSTQPQGFVSSAEVVDLSALFPHGS
ncbi:hypothetical protein CF326_g5851 [Tilletia indica]|nr:hypothetical protein CF326_g5851 [Tilletia indica]